MPHRSKPESPDYGQPKEPSATDYLGQPVPKRSKKPNLLHRLIPQGFLGLFPPRYIPYETTAAAPVLYSKGGRVVGPPLPPAPLPPTFTSEQLGGRGTITYTLDKATRKYVSGKTLPATLAPAPNGGPQPEVEAAADQAAATTTATTAASYSNATDFSAIAPEEQERVRKLLAGEGYPETANEAFLVLSSISKYLAAYEVSTTQFGTAILNRTTGNPVTDAAELQRVATWLQLQESVTASRKNFLDADFQARTAAISGEQDRQTVEAQYKAQIGVLHETERINAATLQNQQTFEAEQAAMDRALNQGNLDEAIKHNRALEGLQQQAITLDRQNMMLNFIMSLATNPAALYFAKPLMAMLGQQAGIDISGLVGPDFTSSLPFTAGDLARMTPYERQVAIGEYQAKTGISNEDLAFMLQRGTPGGLTSGVQRAGGR